MKSLLFLLFISNVFCMLPLGIKYNYYENDDDLVHLERFIEQLWDAIENDIDEYVNVLQQRSDNRPNNSWNNIDHDSRYYKGIDGADFNGQPDIRNNRLDYGHNGFDYDAFINEIDNRYKMETESTGSNFKYLWFIGYVLISSIAMAVLYAYSKRNRNHAVSEKLLDYYETPLKTHQMEE